MRRVSLFFLVLLLTASCQPSGDTANNDRFEKFESDTTRLTDSEDNETPGVNPEEEDRSEWQNPALVIEKLGNLKGKTVADIGAGTGYFSFRLARQGAQVIAIDIEQEYLEYIDKRQQESMVSPGDYPVETRLSEPDDPLLVNGEADIVLLVNTYTYLSDRISYLEKVKNGMSDEGLITIVDYTSASNPVINDAVTIMDPEEIRRELEQAGFTDVVIDRESLQYQFIITAKK